MRKATLKSTWIPLGLIVIALVILNIGLYDVLSAQPLPETFKIPYHQNFDAGKPSGYVTVSGDWEGRDGTLVQISTTGFDLIEVIPMEIPANQPYQLSTRLRLIEGTGGGGLNFNLQQSQSRQKSHMLRFNVDGGIQYIIYGYYGDDSNFVGQGSVQTSIPPNDTEWHSLGVQITETGYNITLDNQAIVTDVPLQYLGGSVGVSTANAQVAFDDLAVEELGTTDIPAVVEATPIPQITNQPTPIAIVPTAVASNIPSGELVTGDLFDGNGDGTNTSWIPFSGNWAFNGGKLVQQQADGFDFGAGYTQSVTPPYRLRVTFAHQAGRGAGVLFNMASPNTKSSSQMVRYSSDSDYLMWGHFDANGVFIGEGSTAIAAAGTETHALEVINRGTTADFWVDGQPLAVNIPLTFQGNYLGLTASQTVVAYDSLEIFSFNGEALPTPLPPDNTANLNLNTISGNWVTENGVTTQTNSDSVDSIAGTGVTAEIFRVAVSITLPNDPSVTDAGGGIVFHMNGRDDPTLGHMVRLGGGGKELLWGRYDAQGGFIGEGGIPINLEAGIPHIMTLVVRPNDYDVLIDDQLSVSAIPLQRSFGWIGLISFRGPVAFSDFHLTIGQ